MLVGVKYAKENDQGLLKNVNEKYLVDAVSFTEAESRIYNLLGNTIRGDFQVTEIKRSNLVDVFFYDDSDIWHQCKITYIIADENTGKEKKVSQLMLVTAHNVEEAVERIKESLSNMLVSFQVPEVKETKIIEVFPYDSELEGEKAPEGLKPISEVKPD
jgi:hypothetical protein